MAGGSEGMSPEEDKFGALGEDPLADDGLDGGGDLMGALSSAGYNPTPDQIAQIEKILGGGGLDTMEPPAEDPMGGAMGDPMGEAMGGAGADLGM